MRVRARERLRGEREAEREAEIKQLRERGFGCTHCFKNVHKRSKPSDKAARLMNASSTICRVEWCDRTAL